MNARDIKKKISGFRRFITPRRLTGALVAVSVLCSFIPAKIFTTTAEAATRITAATTISSNGDYYISGLSLTNACITVQTGVTATLTVKGTNTINNSGGVYNKAAIALAGTAKLTLILESGAVLNAYGSPGKTGDYTRSNNIGGYAAINVPSGTSLSIKGSGTLRAYGGDAGDTREMNNHTGSNYAPQAGGGAGAGIGGNGGAGRMCLVTQNNGQPGLSGQAAGTIAITENVTVIAYGGGGGSGGYAAVSTASNAGWGDGGSSGGGYPAAGIGGGGGGGGTGGTQSNGSGGAGGGGFSGGGSEGTRYGAQGYNGSGSKMSTQGTLPGGGGYFSPGNYARSGATSGFRGPVGGGGGGANVNSYRGGNGGPAGAGGTVVLAQSATLDARNGSYITTSTSAVQGYGKYPTPIYGQLGYPVQNVTSRNTLMTITGRTDAAVSAELAKNGVVKSLTVTGKKGVGTGAGFNESSNGQYFETPNAPKNVQATYVSAPNDLNEDGSFTDKTFDEKIKLHVTWEAPEITSVRPVAGYNVYVDGVLKKTIVGSGIYEATVTGAKWIESSKVEVKSWYSTNGKMANGWESSESGTYVFEYKAPPAIKGVRESNTSFSVHWSGVNEITPADNSQRIVGYTIYYKVGDYDGEELVPTETDYDNKITFSNSDITGEKLFENVESEKLYYIRMQTHFRDGSTSALSDWCEVTDVYIAPKAPNYSLTRASNTSAELKWRGAEGTGLYQYAIYYRIGEAPDVANRKYDSVVLVSRTAEDTSVTQESTIVTGLQEEQTYYFVIEAQTRKYGSDVSEAKSIFTYIEPEEIKDFTVLRTSDTEAELSWYGARGSGINSYTVFYSDDPNNLDKYSTTYETREKSGTIKISNLDTDGFWYFRIISNTDELGSSPMSAAKRIYSFNDPQAPTKVTGKWVSATSAQISWEGAGGTDIIGYRIYYDYIAPGFDVDKAYIYPPEDSGEEENPDPEATPDPEASPDPGDDSGEEEETPAIKEPPIITVENGATSGTVIIENLPNPTVPRRTYYFRVETVTNPYVVDKKTDEATRVRQYSDPSESYAEVLLYDKPSKPILDTVYAANARARVSKSVVEDDGDNSILSYHVYAVSDGTGEKLDSVWDVDGDTTLENYLFAEELTNGEGYTITVSAVNEAGESEESDAQWIRAGVPTTPENFFIYTGEKRAVIAEYDAAYGNGFPVLGYHIFLNGNTDYDNPDGTAGPDQLRYTTYGKYSGDNVRVRVSAFNMWGDSPMTPEFSRIAGAPTTTYIDPIIYYGGPESADEYGGKTGVDLRWDPSMDNGYRVQYYIIYVTDTVTGEVKEYVAKELGEDEQVICNLNIPCEDLVRGRTYKATIEPNNLAGLGERSKEREFTFGVPQPPQITQLDVAPEQLTVHYTRPNDNGKPITEYRIYRNDDYKYVITDNSPSEDLYTKLLEMLINGNDYRIKVTAVNADGESEPSNIELGIPGDIPYAPRNIDAYAVSDTAIKVLWEAPLIDGGLDITKYNIKTYKLVNDGENITYEPVQVTDTPAEEVTDSDYITSVDGTTFECEIPNLIKGEEYKFEVCAENRAGCGPIAEIDHVPTMIEPGTPVITSAYSDAGSAEILHINLEWQASRGADLHGFDGYELYIVNENASTEEEKYKKVNKDYFTGTTERFTSSSLLRGHSYKLAMRAHNTVGYSDYSNVISLNMGIPQAPINVNVVPDKDSMTVTWEMEDIENTIVTGYRVYLNNTATATEIVLGSTNMTATLTGLETQKTYTVYVRAVNNIGSGLLSEPVKVTLGAPTVPLSVKSTAGYEQIDVSWETPEKDNGYPIESYRIYVNGLYDDTIDNRTVAAPELTTTIDNLTGGVEYEITVRAVNSSGESLSSNITKATPWTQPPKPTLKENSIIAHDTSFDFTFAAPSTNLKMKEYIVYLDGKQVGTTYSSTEPYVTIKKDDKGEYVATVYNVSKGKAEGKNYGHTFYIESVAEDPVDPEKELISKTPQSEDEMYKVTTGVPEAPIIDYMEPGNGSAHIKFHVPNEESVGVDYYEIMYNANVYRYDTNDVIITNLVNKTTYRFLVRAVNSAGTGPYCSEFFITPGTPPAPNLSAQPGDASAELTWTMNEISSEIPLPNKYKIYQDGEFIMESDTINTHITGLENGREYTFAVSAININGEGILSNEVKVTPRNGAGPVINVIATALSNTEIKLTWDTPEYDGGSPIVAYRVSGKGKIETGTVDERSAIISGLDRDTMYKFTIYAKTSFGLGAPYVTDYLRTKTLPGAPVIYGMSSADKTITAKWSEPLDTGEDEIIGYNVYIYDDKTSEYIKVNDEPVNDLLYVINSSDKLMLEPQLEYGVAVAAVNSTGEGPKSATAYTDVVDVVALTAPTAPRNLTAIPTNSTIDLSWVKPVTDGNSSIERYLIYMGRSEDTMEIKTSVEGNVYHATIPGLVNNVEYYIGVVAVNGVTEDNNGYSAMSNIVTAIPYKYAVPTVPTNLKYEMNANGATMKVDWDPVTAEGELYYKVYVNGELVKTITDDTTTIDVPVEDGIKYSVQIISGNESGEAASSYIYAYNDLNIRNSEGVLNLTDANYDGVIDVQPVFLKPDPVGEFSKSREEGSHTVKLRWKGIDVETSDYQINKYYLYVDTAVEKILSFDIDPETGEPTAEATNLTYEDGYYETSVEIDFGVIYTFQVSAANENGESSKSASLLEYEKVEQYPTELKAEQPDNNDLKKIILSWKKPTAADPTSYIVYINGQEYIVIPKKKPAADSPIEGSEINSYGFDMFASEVTGDYICWVDDNGECTMDYSGSDNEEYIFRVSACYNNGIESTRTNAAFASTQKDAPMPPTDLTASVEELTTLSEDAEITLTWTAPTDGDYDFYLLYVNGEPYGETVDGVFTPTRIDKNLTELVYTSELNKFHEFRMTTARDNVNDDGAESQKSNAATALTIPPKETSWIPAADAPTDVNAEFNDDQTEVTITWKAPPVDETGTKQAPNGYNVWINGVKVNTEPVLPGENGELAYTHSPLSPDTQYNIQIESLVITEETDPGTGDDPTATQAPATTVIREGGMSDPCIVVTDPHELPILPAPLNLTGTLENATREINLTWDAVENATSYNLYIYSSSENLIVVNDITDTTYKLTGKADTDYVFRVSAVYAANGDSTESNKSNRWATSTIAAESENYPTPAGAPRIVKSRSDGKSKVAIYWTPPEKDAEDIIGYYVFRDGKYEMDENHKPIIVSADSISASGLYQYTFEDVPEGEKIPTKVIALKKYNNQYIMGTDSNTWYIKLELNIVKNWPPEDDDEPNIPKDDDGDGEADDIGATIKLIGTLEAGKYKNGKITIYDEYDTVVKEQEISGDFEVLVSDIAERKNYKIKFTKNNYLSYTITDFPMDHTMSTINLWTIYLTAGDVNSDDIINIDDLSIVNKNYDRSGDNIEGDISGDDYVGIDDLGLVNANYNKVSVTTTWQEHNSSIKQ